MSIVVIWPGVQFICSECLLKLKTESCCIFLCVCVCVAGWLCVRACVRACEWVSVALCPRVCEKYFSWTGGRGEEREWECVKERVESFVFKMWVFSAIGAWMTTLKPCGLWLCFVQVEGLLTCVIGSRCWNMYRIRPCLQLSFWSALLLFEIFTCYSELLAKYCLQKFSWALIPPPECDVLDVLVITTARWCHCVMGVSWMIPQN